MPQPSALLTTQVAVIASAVAAFASFVALDAVASPRLLQGEHGVGMGPFYAGHESHRLAHRSVKFADLTSELVCKNADVAKKWGSPSGLCDAGGKWLGVPPHVTAVQALGLIGGILAALTAVAGAGIVVVVHAPRARAWWRGKTVTAGVDPAVVLGVSIAGGVIAALSSLSLIATYAVWAATPLVARLTDAKTAVVPVWNTFKTKLELSKAVHFEITSQPFVNLVSSSVLSLFAAVALLILAVEWGKSNRARAGVTVTDADADAPASELPLLRAELKVKGEAESPA